MMIDEGEVKTSITHGVGFVFNKDGFANRTPSRETVQTLGFVSVWAISMKDLEEISRTSAKIK